MWKFYDSIKAHLLIPQLVARGYPLEILVLGSLTHKSPRCLQVGNGYSDIMTGCASSILAGCLQSCSWARGLLFELVHCEDHIDDLSQIVTSTCRIQLFHDAALIGRAVKEGIAKLGLTNLVLQSTLLANDKHLGKLIVGHLGEEGVPICVGTTITDMEIETAAEKRICAANPWKRIWKGRRRAKRVNRLCKMNSVAQNLTMPGIHPVQSLRPHRAGSVHHTGQCDVQKLQNGFGDGQNPNVRLFHSRMVLRRKASATNCHPICSVLEAGWKPSTPGFWQKPDASATLDGVLFNKAQIIDSFSRDMDMQTWKRAAGHPLSAGMEKGVITDFAKKAWSQLTQEGNLMAARALDFLVCGAINEPCLLADGSVPNQFSVYVATREPWAPGSMNCENVLETA